MAKSLVLFSMCKTARVAVEHDMWNGRAALLSQANLGRFGSFHSVLEKVQRKGHGC
jgi:hypothetical protein